MKRLEKAFPWVVVFIIMAYVPVMAAEFATTPKDNQGKKWHIGYYEGGEYIDYQKSLVATVYGLMDLGWIDNTAIPSSLITGEQTKEIWNWLATDASSKYLEFVKDAHYTSGWDKKEREKNAAAVNMRLSGKKDLDLIIAMGTWAGKDLSNDNHSTPTIVMSTSSALKAKIIKSVEDSGRDNVHARVDPYRFERQVRVFHDMIGFKKLGVAYEDTVDGRNYAAIDKIEKVAKERGFEIANCFTQSDVSKAEVADESVIQCYSELVKKVDAIYITAQGGVNKKTIPQLVEIFKENHVPTFSMTGGSRYVEKGVLASLSRASFKPVGTFYALTIAKVFNGAKPRQLTQLFEAPPKIAINLKTAIAIGYDPPVDILGAADEVFQ